MRIVESIHGTWHYHLTDEPKDGNDTLALCGAQTMWSPAPIESWGCKPSHMPTSYCRKCDMHLPEPMRAHKETPHVE